MKTHRNANKVESEGPRRTTLAAALAACLVFVGAPMGVVADDADAAYLDIVGTYGTVPGFFHLFSRDDVAEGWEAFTTLQMNPDLAMDAKTRELIGIATASQGPCRPCVYFHAAAALANGASNAEIREAVDIGAATRRLNAALGKAGADADRFKRETNLVLWGDSRTIQLRGPSADFCEVTSVCD